MSNTVMPSFDQVPEFGSLVGRILSGYGELELEMAICLSQALGQHLDDGVRTVFLIRNAEDRVKAVKKELKGPASQAGVGEAYAETMAAMNWCRKVRNQFAHCQWYHTEAEGFCIVDLEVLAKKIGPLGPLADSRVKVNQKLLEDQNLYMRYTTKCFWHLGEAIRRHLFPPDKLRGERTRPPSFPQPPLMKKPPLHRGPVLRQVQRK
jgi:hypothetical protein